jgi:hypothetical protein
VTEFRLLTARTTKRLPGIATPRTKSVFCLERRWRWRDAVPQNGDSLFGAERYVFSVTGRPISFILALLETALLHNESVVCICSITTRQWSTIDITPGAWLISCNYCRMYIARYRTVHPTMLHTAMLPRLSLLLYCHAVWLYRRKYNSIHRHNKNTALLTLSNSIIACFNMHNWKINEKIKGRSLFTLQNKHSRKYVAQKTCLCTDICTNQTRSAWNTDKMLFRYFQKVQILLHLFSQIYTILAILQGDWYIELYPVRSRNINSFTPLSNANFHEIHLIPTVL